eukprot:3676794-Amphidinium_carterae.1
MAVAGIRLNSRFVKSMFLYLESYLTFDPSRLSVGSGVLPRLDALALGGAFITGGGGASAFGGAFEVVAGGGAFELVAGGAFAFVAGGGAFPAFISACCLLCCSS